MSRPNFASHCTIENSRRVFHGARSRAVRCCSGWLLPTLMLLIAASPVYAQNADSPANLSATLAKGTVTLTWAEPSTNAGTVTGYQVLRRRPGHDATGVFHEIARTGGGETSYADGDVDAEVSYTYRVKAIRGGVMSEWSHYARVDVPLAPLAPGGLAATAGRRSVTLEWTDPGDSTIDGYEVRHGESTAALPAWEASHEIADSDSSTSGHSVAGLDDGTEYTFEVRAYNEGGAGPASSVTATPSAPPAAPDSLTATIGDGTVKLTWADPHDATITGYELRHTVGSAGLGRPPVWSGDSWPVVDADSAAVRRVTVGNLTNGSPYTFQLRALNAAGEGASSGVVAFPSEAPWGLAAVASEGAVTLTWDGPGYHYIDQFEYRYAPGDDADPPEWEGVAWHAVTHGSRRVTVANLTNGTTYAFEVRVVDEDGNRGTTASRVTERPGPRPAAPDSLTATIGDATVTLTWADPGDGAITGYELRHVANGAFSVPVWDNVDWMDVAAADTAARRTTVGNLTNGRPYFFQLRASYDDGAGAPSGVTAFPAGAPQGLEATAGDGTVTLRWDNPGYTVRGYEYRAAEGDDNNPPDWSGIEWNAVPRGDRAVTVRNLDNGTTYTFEVRVVDLKGNKGTQASRVEATPAAPPAARPAAPDSLTATVGDSTVTLTWADPDDTIGGYELRRGLNGIGGSPIWTEDGWTAIDSVSAAVRRETVGALINGYPYTFELRAFNDGGAGDSSGVVACPAGAPQGLAAMVGDGTVRLTWNNPGYHVGGYEHRYAPWTNNSPPDWAGVEWKAVAHGDRAVTVAKLKNGTTYSFEVRVVDSKRNKGTTASRTMAMLPIPPPRNLEATAGDSTVALSWDDPENETLTGYQISYGQSDTYAAAWNDIASDASTTGHDVPGLNNYTEYTFEVRAFKQTGSSRVVGAPDSVMATPVPEGAPRDLRAVQEAGGDVVLTWLPPVADFASVRDYDLEYRHPEGSGTLGIERFLTRFVHTVPAEIAMGIVDYTYRIGAPRRGKPTRWSQRVTISVAPAPPPAPKNLKATGGNGSVRLSWGFPTYEAISGYQFRYSDTDVAQAAWREIDNSDHNTTSHTVTGLTNGTTYTFEVRAIKPTVNGVPTTVDGTSGVAPGPPENLTATAGKGSVTLAWDDPGNASITLYQVRYSHTDVAQAVWRNIPASDASTTDHEVTGLTNGTTYTFEVRALNVVGPGDASSVTSTPGPPPPPANLIAAAGVGLVTLEWDDSGDYGISVYQIRYGDNEGSLPAWREISGSSDTTTTHTVPDLTNGVEYTFELRATNAVGTGDSSRVTATPVPAAPDSLVATPGVETVALEWVDPDDSAISGYQLVYYSGSRPSQLTWNHITDSDSSTTNHAVTGLTNGTKYTFEVRARAGLVHGDSSIATATPLARPQPPPPPRPTPPSRPNMRNAYETDGKVTIRWANPNDSSIDGYKFRYGVRGTTLPEWSIVSGSNANTTSHAVSGLTNGTIYTFEVRAFNEAGDGPAAGFDARPCKITIHSISNVTLTLNVAMTPIHVTSSGFCTVHRIGLSGEPSWMIYSPGGVISGTPNSVGSHTVTVTASGNFQEATTTFTVTVVSQGDLNGDGRRDAADAAMFNDKIGLRSSDSGFDPRMDLNRDGTINFADGVILSGYIEQDTLDRASESDDDSE